MTAALPGYVAIVLLSVTADLDIKGKKVQGDKQKDYSCWQKRWRRDSVQSSR